MLLISTTRQPATDLGYLLHKNPSRIHVLDLSFGRVVVAYPEAEENLTTVAVMVEVDPVKLVRGGESGGGSLAQYVNDRPYVASSFLSVAIVEAFSTAMSGRCKEKPELVDQPFPIQIHIPVLPCTRGTDLIQELFAPLGYTVRADAIPLDEKFPEWGSGRYVDLSLAGEVTVRDALRHLYILIPVLDAKKHYFMDPQEVDKLLAKGEGWLADHPRREWIVRGYLGRKPSLVRSALDQLANVEEALTTESENVEIDSEETPARKANLHQQRHERVVEIVRELKPRSVVDLGCGEGKLMRMMIPIQGLERIVGMDVSYRELEKASRKLRLDDAGPRMRERVELLHGSLTYRDHRLEGFDCCTVVEVIEHLDFARLAAFSQVVFGFARPKTVILTTPNREYNALYEIERLRHSDHRFEWSRAEFAAWAEEVAHRFGYAVRFEGVGDEHPELGSPSQLAVFAR